jgi:hypothetical protein
MDFTSHANPTILPCVTGCDSVIDESCSSSTDYLNVLVG